MGVEVHANIIDNLLHSEEQGRGFLKRGLNEMAVDTGFILLFGLVFGFLFSRVTPLYSTITVLVTLTAYALVRVFQLRAQRPVAQLCDSGRHAGRELCRHHQPAHDPRRTRQAQYSQKFFAVSFSRRDRADRKRSGEIHSSRRRGEGTHRALQRYPRIHHHLRRPDAGPTGATAQRIFRANDRNCFCHRRHAR